MPPPDATHRQNLAVAHETAGSGYLVPMIDRWQSVTGRQRDKLLKLRKKQSIGINRDGAHLLLSHTLPTA
jgi:hypothetical protein